MSKFEELAFKLESSGLANQEASRVTQWLDTGFPPLNKAVSNMYDGGLPVGRVVEIFGPESSGKTAVMTNAFAAAQRMGGIACMSDHERSFEELQGVKLGLDITPGKWIYRKPKTYEESLELFLKLVQMIRDGKYIDKDAPICWGFDSLAQMIPAAQYGKNFSELNMNDMTALSRVTSQTMKSVALISDEYNVCTIFLNQIRLKVGVVYGDPIETPGGKALKFSASVRIQLGATKISKGKGEESEVIGQQVTARCVKNKVNRPFLKAKWRFKFCEDGSGQFDAVGSMLDFMTDKGILKMAGAYILYDGKKYYREALVDRVTADGGVPVLMAMIDTATVEVEVDEEAAALAAEESEVEDAVMSGREAALAALATLKAAKTK